MGETNATLTLSADQVCEVEKDWLPVKKWKQMSLKRTLKESVLRACGGHRLWGEEDTHAAEHVELLKNKPQMLLDQHLLYGWEMLRWHLSDSDDANFFLEQSVRMLDPKLTTLCLSGKHSNPALLESVLKKQLPDCKMLFAPIWGQGLGPIHWTLLVLTFEGDVPSVQYLDSLSEKHAACAANAAKLLSLLLPGQALPERSECPFQKGHDCGFWVLSNMLWILSKVRGEGPCARGSRGKMALELMSHLKAWLQQLQSEQLKLFKAEEQAEKALKKTLKANAAKAAKAAALHKTKSEAADLVASAAHKLINLGKEPEISDLSAEDKAVLQKVQDYGLRVCSRCRWQSGCLDCHPDKCARYLLNNLRLKLGLPSIK